MDSSASEFRAQEDDLARRDARSWACCIGVIATIAGLSAYALAAVPRPAPTAPDVLSSGIALGYNVCVAVCGAMVLLHSYLDTRPVEFRTKVVGRPEIPLVSRDFTGLSKWVQLTFWSNTVGVAYFVFASAVGILQRGGGQAPATMIRATGVLWDIAFPMSFIINLVVSFVLIPGYKREGEYFKVDNILKWRNQACHNGFVFAAAAEAAIVLPPMHLADVPIVLLYGASYVVFAWILLKRTGIMTYFFLDPRFKFAPCAIPALVGLFGAVYCACCAVTVVAAEHWLPRAAIVPAALVTCTFRDAGATAPAPGATGGSVGG